MKTLFLNQGTIASAVAMAQWQQHMGSVTPWVYTMVTHDYEATGLSQSVMAARAQSAKVDGIHILYKTASHKWVPAGLNFAAVAIELLCTYGESSDTIVLPLFKGPTGEAWPTPDDHVGKVIELLNKMARWTRAVTAVVCPLAALTYPQVVMAGINAGVNFATTWDCRKVFAEEPCGVCPECVARIEAFKVVGERDPAPYSIEIQW